MTDFLRFLISNSSYKTWEETALSWFFTVIMVAFVWAILMILIKVGIKLAAGHAVDKIWKRSAVWGFIFFWFIPIFISIFIFWYMSEDFFKVAYVGGLAKGVFLAWIVYLFSILLVHFLYRPWRNEL